MKQLTLYCLMLFTNFLSFAQNKDTWIAFQNADSTLTGFKDSKGNIKIAPKFMGMSIAHKFDDIMVVSEETNATWKSYYLTKSGKIVGRDSLYIYDNGPDCENEGFIRFKDYKTDKMGLFNSDGKIVIPAQYSSITRVRNGIIIALKDAVKIQDGEHYFWSGGKEYLIDTTNKVLVENFAYTDELNFYSLEKSKEQNPDPIRDHFLGVDGLYYSFINFDKEFKAWLKNNLLSDVSKDNLIKNSFDKITYWKEPNGWVAASKTKFIGQNYTFIKLKLQELNAAKTDYFVSSDGLNKFIFETSEYKMYFNNCNEPKDWQYPVKNIVISSKNKSDFGQDHLQFLKTENGYKLISVSSGKEELK